MKRLRILITAYWYIVVVVVIVDAVSQYYTYNDTSDATVMLARAGLHLASHVASAFLHGGAYFLGFGILAEAMYLIAGAAREIAQKQGKPENDAGGDDV